MLNPLSVRAMSIIARGLEQADTGGGGKGYSWYPVRIQHHVRATSPGWDADVSEAAVLSLAEKHVLHPLLRSTLANTRWSMRVSLAEARALEQRMCDVCRMLLAERRRRQRTLYT